MINNHVTSLAQSRKLYELGFERETVFYWKLYRSISNPRRLSIGSGEVPAYLLSEIMENFDYDFKIRKDGVGFEATLWEHGRYNAKSATIALCDLILYGLEEGFITLPK